MPAADRNRIAAASSSSTLAPANVLLVTNSVYLSQKEKKPTTANRIAAMAGTGAPLRASRSLNTAGAMRCCAMPSSK